MDTKIDIAILGAGIAGSTLALIFARQGLEVAVFDQGTHPRFALGEATIPSTSYWMKVIANRWNVPELQKLSSVSCLQKEIMPTSGSKAHFGFAYHKPGEQTLADRWQVPVILQEKSSTEAHLFRQDIDAYLYYQAINAGADDYSGVRVEDIDLRDDGVGIKTADGRQIDAQFVIDAAGFRSPISDKLGLRQQPSQLKTRSRAIFTHMIGVKPFDEIDTTCTPFLPWHNGTMHHVFDGGWMWVIPFDNNPMSKNPLCSVGLNLDEDIYPFDSSISAKQEWDQFMGMFPIMAAQFSEARSVRPWVQTPRLQYSNTSTVGNRYWITMHAGGTVDALYSRGMLNTFQTSHTAAQLIIDMVKGQCFDQTHLAPLETMASTLLEIQDLVVYGSYGAFCDPKLFDLWIAVWWIASEVSNLKAINLLRNFASTGKPEALTDQQPEQAIIHQEAALTFFRDCTTVIDQLKAKKININESITQLTKLLDDIGREYGFDHNDERNYFNKQVFCSDAHAQIREEMKTTLEKTKNERKALLDLGVYYY